MSKLEDLKEKYRFHEIKPIKTHVDRSIRTKKLFDENIQFLKTLSTFFDENEDYEVQITLQDSDRNKFFFRSFERLMEKLGEWDTQSTVTPSEKIFRYGSYEIIIEERHGKDLYVLGEMTVSDMSHYDYFRSSKPDDIIEKLFS